MRAMDMEALVDSLSVFSRLENRHHRYKLELVEDVYKRKELERVRSVRHLTDWCQVSSKEHMADA